MTSNRNGPNAHTRPRIAFFTHDTFGLGHVTRCFHIIHALASRLPESSLLLISGSPILHLFKRLPPNADYVKIPTVVKTGAPDSQPPHLPLSVSEITSLRAQIIRETVRGFNPDVLIVDNFPLGSNQELLSTLKEAKGNNIRMILGLRDIVDAADVVRADWTKHGIYDVLDRYYDQILIYGCREIFDAGEAYAIPERIAKKVRYCGYLTSTAPLKSDRNQTRNELELNGPMILVTGGGGGDAFPLLSTFLQALPLLPEVTALVVLGPMMGSSDRNRLHDMADGKPNVIVREFLSDLPRYICAADVVVSMCGYNLAAEIVVHRPQAVVVPRNWRYGEHNNRRNTLEEREQLIRAQAMSRRGLVRLVEPHNLNAESLAEKINEALQNPPLQTTTTFSLGGLESAVQCIQEMLVREGQ